MSNNSKFIKLGECRKPHGIKGAFLFHLFNDDGSVLENNSVLTLKALSDASSIGSKEIEVEIDSIHFGNKTVCYFKGIRDRNIVEKMIPFEIYYPRDKFPPLDENQWYLSDLEGLTVLSEEGDNIGIVEGHFDNGAQIVLSVKCDGEIIDLPFVEAFFKDINIEERTIVMIKPEYD